MPGIPSSFYRVATYDIHTYGIDAVEAQFPFGFSEYSLATDGSKLLITNFNGLYCWVDFNGALIAGKTQLEMPDGIGRAEVHGLAWDAANSKLIAGFWYPSAYYASRHSINGGAVLDKWNSASNGSDAFGVRGMVWDGASLHFLMINEDSQYSDFIPFVNRYDAPAFSATPSVVAPNLTTHMTADQALFSDYGVQGLALYNNYLIAGDSQNVGRLNAILGDGRVQAIPADLGDFPVNMVAVNESLWVAGGNNHELFHLRPRYGGGAY